MKVIAVSDVHLGYENCDKPAFNSFLDHLLKGAEATDFVLLGDIMDMWRRDSSGVFLENWDTIKKVMALQKEKDMKIHYIAGNHDFHVMKLQNHSYPFNFVEELTLLDGDHRYRFVHGYQFDTAQQKPLMEALCRVMSDEAGEFESGVWATLTRNWSDLKYFFSSLFRKQSIRKATEKLQLKAEVRLKDAIGLVERNACSNARLGEILVFGHTHKPFINTKANVANTGSWVKDSPVHNTYVKVEAGKPRLFVFGGQEITDRIEC